MKSSGQFILLGVPEMSFALMHLAMTEVVIYIQKLDNYVRG